MRRNVLFIVAYQNEHGAVRFGMAYVNIHVRYRIELSAQWSGVDVSQFQWLYICVCVYFALSLSLTLLLEKRCEVNKPAKKMIRKIDLSMLMLHRSQLL